MSDKPLNIKILTTEPFPIGLAATNRIMTYAKGFAEMNCQSTVMVIKPTEWPNKIFNNIVSGNINGAFYTYPGGKTLLDPKFLIRRYDNLKASLRCTISLLKEKSDNKTDAIIFYSPSTSRAILLLLITRIKKILFLKEESEFPTSHIKKMNFIQKFFFLKLHPFLFDGSLIMTNRLIEYYVNERKRTTPYLHVPMTVDFERFANIKRNISESAYIAYCGVLNNEKDGVNLLIDAFALIAKEFPSLLLYLIGDAPNELQKKQYINQVKDYNLFDRVIFTGRIGKDEIPDLMVNAKILVLPRPNSLQSEGGFPTKLGEYLATGNPVIVTSVGEIPNYLTNQENVFMAEPGNVDSLVSEFKNVLHNYPKALQIGENGKKVVKEYFNYKIQTKNIIQFIKSLKRY